jgi:hypothetical protein
MQFKQIALAVAATLVAGHAAAAAVTQADVAAARSASTLQETWLSGASAPTFNVFQGFALGCDAGSVAIFTNNATAGRPGSIGDYNAYACTRGGVVSVAYHTVAGGSFNAYAPHVDGTQLQRVKALDTASCSVTGSVTIGSTVYPVKANCNRLNPVTTSDNGPTLPAGGFSDVEAALFGFDVSSAGTEAQANVGQVFGLAVSTNLYRALQTAQGLSDVNATTFDPANAPNLSSAQYTSIIAQGAAYQTDWSPILGATGTGKKIVLARRVATSGTQASSNAHFLKNPCNGDPAVQGLLAPAGAGDSVPGAFEVSEASGTSDVKVALTTANTNGHYAIGVVSLENDWRAETNAARKEYRFLKLDGVHPEAGDVTYARAKALTGDYAFHMEMRNFVANSADSFGAALIPEITASLGNPANCADVPRGLTLNPLGGSSCTAGVEVAKHTRFGNNCQATQLFF